MSPPSKLSVKLPRLTRRLVLLMEPMFFREITDWKFILQAIDEFDREFNSKGRPWCGDIFRNKMETFVSNWL